MIVNRSFNSMTDRYAFDFGECSYDNGFAQFDSREDASYYGTWINPTERKFVQFAEGDITRIEFASDEEMVCYCHGFAESMGGKIDPGLRPEMKTAFEAAGLGHLLH